jgi:RimJ/RimL family protein N-acetyltransferase
MPTTKVLPKKICSGDIKLSKISMKNDNDKLVDLFYAFKRNIEHLNHWFHEVNPVLNNIYDIKKHYKGYICYDILNNGKIIGCIGISKIRINMSKIKTGKKISIFRQLNYWIDKDYTRRGIMYKCLKLFEKIFIAQGLDYIIAVIEEINIPSVNLVKKLGFKEHDVCYFLVDEENHIQKKKV